MARSNTANGGNTYVDLVIQLVSASDTQYVLRAVVYLTSYNVVDSTNTLAIGGNWSRGGALALNGVYSGTAVWYQDITVNRVVGANVGVSVSMSWSSVEYWGTTLTASEGYTVPARYEAPNPPGTGVDSITSNSARIVVAATDYNGGAPIDAYEAYVMTNNAWPGSGGNVVASASGGTFNTGAVLSRATNYYYTSRCHNTAGYWSGWTAMKVFTTLATAPDAPAMPTVGAIAPDGAPISWSAPNNGGSAVTGYDLQIATNSGFTAGVQTFTNVTSPYTLTGLLPATQYWVRVRAKNAIGTGAWSAANLFTTLSGVKVKVAGTWRNAKLWVKVGGVWVLAPKVWKKHDDVWSI